MPDYPIILFGIGQVHFDDGRKVATAHYRLSQSGPSAPWRTSVSCLDLPNLESLQERRLILDLIDGRRWHFTVDAELNCVERSPGLETVTTADS